MATRSRGRASGGVASRVLFFFIGGSVMVALWQNIGHGDLGTLLDNLRGKSAQLEQKYQRETPKIVDEVTKGVKPKPGAATGAPGSPEHAGTPSGAPKTTNTEQAKR